jgi:hypothetical protein
VKHFPIRPHLALCIRKAPHLPGGDYQERYFLETSFCGRDKAPLACLSFTYGDTMIKGCDHRSHYKDSKGNEHERDRLQEASIIKRLEKTGLRLARTYNLPADILAFKIERTEVRLSGRS